MPDYLKQLIRDIPDFPKPGIVFKDITTLLSEGPAFARAIDLIAGRYLGKGIDRVVAMEARGFILGAPLAYRLGAGFVPVRKKASCLPPPLKRPMPWSMARTLCRCTRMP